MKKLVVLKFDGALKSGFRVNLTISNAEETPNLTISAKLPSARALIEQSQSWCYIYRSFYGQSRIRPLGTKNVNIEALNQDFAQKSQELINALNKWLASDSFVKVKVCLEKLNIEDEIRIIIATSCQELRKLPWHLWDVLQKYPYVEVALSAPDAERGERIYRDKARILIVLGDSTGINVEADRELLQEYCKNGEIILLKEPSCETLIDHLRDNAGWDMLFFSGHSRTEGSQGRIFLNKDDTLTMVELRDAMQRAINKRLQIAFFNSCDGLGIALELEQLNIPQVIVMREPVPDKVAQEFLKCFLQEFTGGKSLYLSIRKAREHLHNHYDVTFPCASWLPVIIQNQLETPPTWQSLGIISLCPYRGLKIFQEQHAELFFGREAFVKDLLINVTHKPFVAVVGASGSGKSSVIFAGLIPKLHQDINTKWQIISFRPGNKPLKSLAIALKESKNKTLLIIDQFEEIFTLCSDVEERKIFIDKLLQEVNNSSTFTLLITLRADFIGKAISYEPLGKALQKYPPSLLAPMNRQELENAIIQPAATVTNVSFSPDGKLLASASGDGTIKLWNVKDIKTAKIIKTLKGHKKGAAVFSVSFSPDGKMLASASADETVKLWDVSTGKEIQTFTGHKSTVSNHNGNQAVFGVTFSPDSKLVASASADQTIKLSDVKTGEVINTLKGHTAQVWGLSFSPDGKTLASASRDSTIKL